MKLRLLLIFALLAAGTRPAVAASLKDAEVRHALNDVRIAEPAGRTIPASTRAVLRGGAAILTGAQSRAELIFPDQTLARLGAETAVRFGPGSRDIQLDRGTLLLQIPKLRGGARVLIGSLTASAGSATFLIEHLPAGSVKVAVLEGDLRISANGFLGDSIVLPPGKMLIAKPDVRRIPDPVDVDVRTLTQTSSLIVSTIFAGDSGMAVSPLPSMPLIARTIGRQAGLVKARTLFPTNLQILGSGTTVVIPAAPPAAAPGEPAPLSPPLPASAGKIVATETGSDHRED